MRGVISVRRRPFQLLYFLFPPVSLANFPPLRNDRPGTQKLGLKTQSRETHTNASPARPSRILKAFFFFYYYHFRSPGDAESPTPTCGGRAARFPLARACSAVGGAQDRGRHSHAKVGVAGRAERREVVGRNRTH